MYPQHIVRRAFIREIKRPAAVRDEREADEQFVAWVLGYGYAAGHVPPHHSEQKASREQPARRLT